MFAVTAAFCIFLRYLKFSLYMHAIHCGYYGKLQYEKCFGKDSETIILPDFGYQFKKLEVFALFKYRQ